MRARTVYALSYLIGLPASTPFHSQRQADRNRAKVLERLEKRKQKGVKEKKKSTTPKLTQEECLGQLRQFVGLAPIAGIQKRTLVNITRVTNQ
jgi:hypothetical protein